MTTTLSCAASEGPAVLRDFVLPQKHKSVLKPRQLASFPPLSRELSVQVEPPRAQLCNNVLVTAQIDVKSPCLSRHGPGDDDSTPRLVRSVAQNLLLILPGHVLAHLQHHHKVGGMEQGLFKAKAVN